MLSKWSAVTRSAKISGATLLKNIRKQTTVPISVKNGGQSSRRALCARRLEGIAHPAGHGRRRHIGLKALAAMVLCLATKYGTGTDGRAEAAWRAAAAAEEQNRGRQGVPLHTTNYIEYYYVSEQAASFCSSTTEAADAIAAVSTANNGLTSYQQTIQAMSEEKRRRRRQPLQQPLKQPRPASNWFEAVLQTCMTHKGHHHGLFFSISQHSSHSSRSSLYQEEVVATVPVPLNYCTAIQRRRPAFLVEWNDANGIYLSQYWTGSLVVAGAWSINRCFAEPRILETAAAARWLY